jgi:hypothetical protein
VTKTHKTKDDTTSSKNSYGHPSFAKQGGVSHSRLAIYIKKDLKAKEELWKNSNISSCTNLLFKKSSKTNQNLSRYYKLYN